jgi:hypothetical protein
MKTSHGIVPARELNENVVEQMYQLMLSYYDNCRKEKFLADLYQKDGVLLVRDPNDDVCGFTTYVLFETAFQGEKIHVFYSGDTIIREEFWGRMSTVRLFIFLLRRYLLRPRGALYWFLLSKGIRTYRLLPLYFKRYYPAPDGVAPVYEKDMTAHLAQLKFGGGYLAKEGVIRPDPPADRLKEKFLLPAENKMDDPLSWFFFGKNPGCVRGDELPCLAHMSLDNLTPIARRWMGQYASQESVY